MRTFINDVTQSGEREWLFMIMHTRFIEIGLFARKRKCRDQKIMNICVRLFMGVPFTTVGDLYNLNGPNLSDCRKVRYSGLGLNNKLEVHYLGCV